MNTQEISRDASLSKCGNYRWYLSRQWGGAANEGFVAFLMTNPSTADASIDDPTIRKCMALTGAWGYGHLIVVNLFPFRSSSPAECKKWYADGQSLEVREAIAYNAGHIEVAGEQAALCVAAFGNNVIDPDYATKCLVSFNKQFLVYCLGTTKAGWPKHPLARGKHRIPDDFAPVLYT